MPRGGGCLLRHVSPVPSGRHCAAWRDSLRLGNAVNNPIQEEVGVLFGSQGFFFVFIQLYKNDYFPAYCVFVRMFVGLLFI